MQGYSPKLPLIQDKIDGLYSMNKTIIDAVKQDFKMLMLTNPGERIMNPDFGVGLRALLFSQKSDNLKNTITARINSQIAKYLNFIVIEEINISDVSGNENAFYVSIKYSIPSLKVDEELNILLDSN